MNYSEATIAYAEDEYRRKIAEIVAKAPPLSNEQIATLRSVIIPNEKAAAERAAREAEERRRAARRKVEEHTRREQAEEAERLRIAEAERAAKRCALYRHFDSEDTLLYVGISRNSVTRRMDHMREAIWARFQASETVVWFDDREQAEAAEQAAIRDESPVFNILHAGPSARERRVRYLAAREAWDLLADRRSRP